MTLEKGLAPFHAVVEMQTAQPKNLISEIEIQKDAHQIVKRV